MADDRLIPRDVAPPDALTKKPIPRPIKKTFGRRTRPLVPWSPGSGKDGKSAGAGKDD